MPASGGSCTLSTCHNPGRLGGGAGVTCRLSTPRSLSLCFPACLCPRSRKGTFVIVIWIHASQIEWEHCWEASRKLLLCEWGLESEPKELGPNGGWEGPSGPPDWKGLCFLCSLLLKHLLRSWERIPKKVRSWENMAGSAFSGLWICTPQPLFPLP